MKNNVKAIIASSVAALAFGAISVGTTFALFTSKDEATISVQSGVVNVEQSVSILSVRELGDEAVEPTEGVYTNSIGGKTYLDPQNNSALHLEKWAPGDSVTLEIRNINKSNVAIRSRFTVDHSSTSEVDLFNALTYTVRAWDKDNVEISDSVSDWATYLAAEDISVGYLLSRIEVTINFPDQDDGEIDFESYDNQFQDANCTFCFTQETVQGNAYTPNTDSQGI